MLKKSTKGQALPEYALILALIALSAVVFLTTFGQNLSGDLNTMAERIYNSAMGN